MRRTALIACLAAALSPAAALADGASLARLPRDVMAPEVIRPQGAEAVVGVLLQGMSGEGGKVVTFGQAFRQGDWPQGRGLHAMANGAELELQADIKARWPDGSARHAILSLIEPAAREAQVSLVLGAPQAPRPALDLNTVFARGYDMRLETEMMGHQMAFNLRPLLMDALARPDVWLSGPLVSEMRATKRLTDQLTLVVDLRGQADGAVRTSVAVFNDMLGKTTGEVAYKIKGVMAGQQAFAHEIDHIRFSGWRDVVWAGTQPSGAHVVYDGPYLIASGAMPPYDPKVEIIPGVINTLIEESMRDPGPMGAGGITKAMPTTGGRADIGVIPAWALVWLRAQTPETKAAMLRNGEAAASVPWRLRDPKTGINATLTDHPTLWADYRSQPADHEFGGTITTEVDGWALDNSHQPDLSYTPYLVTGDRHYLDGLVAQHFFGLLRYNPLYRSNAEGNLDWDEVRGQAWATRTHAFAAFITPDDHPNKREIVERLESRLEWYPRTYRRDSNPEHGGPPQYETAGWIAGENPSGIMSNWQQDFFAMAIAQAGMMGSRAAAGVYGYTRQYMLNRFLRTDFDPHWSTIYLMIHGDLNNRQPFATWAEVTAANLADGRFKPNPTEMEGGPINAWDYTAQGRAGYAAALSAFPDPLLAEAYAFIAANNFEAVTNGAGYTAYPAWSLVPRFADGTLLSLADTTVGDDGEDSYEGEGDAPHLFYGGGGNDVGVGGPGNEILAGWDGDDVLTGGLGENFLAGGRGNDRIVIEGGVNHVAMGPGDDAAFFGRDAAGRPAPLGVTDIWDFDPRADALVLPDTAAGTLRDSPDGAVFEFGAGERLLLRGVAPGALNGENVRLRPAGA